jgi:hypothetical protein
MGDTYHSDISGRAAPIPRLFREGLRQSLGYFALSGLEMELLVSDF